MEIGLDNYKFGRKNNWRRWKWNRIIERLEAHKRGDCHISHRTKRYR